MGEGGEQLPRLSLVVAMNGVVKRRKATVDNYPQRL